MYGGVRSNILSVWNEYVRKRLYMDRYVTVDSYLGKDSNYVSFVSSGMEG